MLDMMGNTGQQRSNLFGTSNNNFPNNNTQGGNIGGGSTMFNNQNSISETIQITICMGTKTKLLAVTKEIIYSEDLTTIKETTYLEDLTTIKEIIYLEDLTWITIITICLEIIRGEITCLVIKEATICIITLEIAGTIATTIIAIYLTIWLESVFIF